MVRFIKVCSEILCYQAILDAVIAYEILHKTRNRNCLNISVSIPVQLVYKLVKG